MIRTLTDAIAPRLVEPSTWAGVVTVLGTLAGRQIAPEYGDAIATVLASVAGLVLVLTKEQPK